MAEDEQQTGGDKDGGEEVGAGADPSDDPGKIELVLEVRSNSRGISGAPRNWVAGERDGQGGESGQSERQPDDPGKIGLDKIRKQEKPEERG